MSCQVKTFDQCQLRDKKHQYFSIVSLPTDSAIVDHAVAVLYRLLGMLATSTRFVIIFVFCLLMLSPTFFVAWDNLFVISFASFKSSAMITMSLANRRLFSFTPSIVTPLLS
jgi:hypothetical protein